MEVLVSLLVISFISALLYFSYSVCIRSVESSKKKISTEVLRINTDTILRNSIEKISIPIWESDFEYNMEDHIVIFSWMNGLQGNYSVEVDKRVTLLNINPMKTEGEKIVGFTILYSINNVEFETIALFASRPYGEFKI